MGQPYPNRDVLLTDINGIFRSHGLPVWETKHLGSAEKGECQIVGLRNVRDLPDGRIEIEFEVIVPVTGPTAITARFGGPMVFVLPYLGTTAGQNAGLKIALMKHWRVEIGEWSYELPHGFDPRPGDGTEFDPIDSPAHRVLERTFGDVCSESLGASRVMPLTDLRLRHEAAPAKAYLLVASVLRPFPRRIGEGEIVLLDWPQVMCLLRRNNFVTDPTARAILYEAAFLYPDLK